jgi:hypothetical protein
MPLCGNVNARLLDPVLAEQHCELSQFLHHEARQLNA